MKQVGLIVQACSLSWFVSHKMVIINNDVLFYLMMKAANAITM